MVSRKKPIKPAPVSIEAQKVPVEIVEKKKDFTQLITESVSKTFIAACLAAFVAYLDYKSVQRDKETARKVEVVRVTLESETTDTQNKLTNIEKTAEETHKIVNSESVAKAKILALIQRRVADLSKDPEEVKLAEEFEKEYKERAAQQKKLVEDSQP